MCRRSLSSSANSPHNDRKSEMDPFTYPWRYKACEYFSRTKWSTGIKTQTYNISFVHEGLSVSEVVNITASLQFFISILSCGWKRFGLTYTCRRTSAIITRSFSLRRMQSPDSWLNYEMCSHIFRMRNVQRVIIVYQMNGHESSRIALRASDFAGGSWYKYSNTNQIQIPKLFILWFAARAWRRGSTNESHDYFSHAQHKRPD